jgi:hypothetical protein
METGQIDFSGITVGNPTEMDEYEEIDAVVSLPRVRLFIFGLTYNLWPLFEISLITAIRSTY